MLRVPTRLDEQLESLITEVIGLCIAVHRALGPGLLETAYRRAICLDLRAAGLEYETEKRVPILYRGEQLCYHQLDIVVAGRLLLEIKSVERLAGIHHAQVRSYLRVAKLPVGLLINFNVPVLPDGLRRIVN